MSHKRAKKRRTHDEYDDDETDQSLKRHGSSANGRKKKIGRIKRFAKFSKSLHSGFGA